MVWVIGGRGGCDFFFWLLGVCVLLVGLLFLLVGVLIGVLFGFGKVVGVEFEVFVGIDLFCEVGVLVGLVWLVKNVC